MKLLKIIREGVKSLIDKFYLFTLEWEMRSKETDEARACRLITEDIEASNKEINGK